MSFSTELKFKHGTSDPTYPQSHSLAERAVITAKQLINKCREYKSNVYLALLNLRNTPCKEGVLLPLKDNLGEEPKHVANEQSIVETNYTNTRRSQTAAKSQKKLK